jgi:hypothetical protein
MAIGQMMPHALSAERTGWCAMTADYIDTDPKSQQKSRILQQQAPDRYRRLLVLLDAVLREVFQEIGPDTTKVRKGLG